MRDSTPLQRRQIILSVTLPGNFVVKLAPKRATSGSNAFDSYLPARPLGMRPGCLLCATRVL